MKILKIIVIKILFNTIGLFYDKKYLYGFNYEKSFIGWRWIFKTFLHQKVLGFNRHVPWPISPSSAVDDPKNIFFHPDDSVFFMHFGCYFSNTNGGKIFIGKGTFIAPNTGIITTNHNPSNVSEHLDPKDVKIGKNCWIGMNAMIMPGVILGDNTIVAAGAIVTKSFTNGLCVIGGNPAKLIKKIN